MASPCQIRLKKISTLGHIIFFVFFILFEKNEEIKLITIISMYHLTFKTSYEVGQVY